MIEKFVLKRFKCYPGAIDGLAQPTVRVDLSFEGSAPPERLITPRLAWACNQIIQIYPQYDLVNSNLPRDFILPPGFGGTAEADAEGTRSEKDETKYLEWLTAVAVVLQRLANEPVGRAKVKVVARPTQSLTRATLSLPYRRQDVARHALVQSIRLLLLCHRDGRDEDRPADPAWTRWKRETIEWLAASRENGLDSIGLQLAIAALNAGHDVSDMQGILNVGQGANRLRFNASFSDRTSAVAANLARNKVATLTALEAQAIPVPKRRVVSSWKAAQDAASELGWPLVVKPVSEDMGRGVSTGIKDTARLERAYINAAKHSPTSVIIERHVQGDDYRVLVVCGKAVVTTRRIPGRVTGDGKRSIRDLVAELNADPRRGTHRRSLTMKIEIDDEAHDCLKGVGLSQDDIPQEGQHVTLRQTANIATGGTAEDATSDIHSDNLRLCERAAKITGLDIAGIDLICPDIRRSWKEVGAVVIEVNAQPGMRPHWLAGGARNVNAEILRTLFADRSSHIPTVMVVGANPAPFTSRMLQSMLQENGARAGRSEMAGVWLNDEVLTDRPASEFVGARMLLANPEVEASIFDFSFATLRSTGHPCDAYSVVAVMNVQGESVQGAGSDPADDLNCLVAECVARSRNAAVINADDPFLRGRLFSEENRLIRPVGVLEASKLVLVTSGQRHDWLKSHLSDGGKAVLIERIDGAKWIVGKDANGIVPLIAVGELCEAGANETTEWQQSGLYAAAIAWAHGVAPDHIRKALLGFS